MKAEEAYALSRKYTENTVAGAGAVAGKPCQIQSITDITGGHRITFLWKDNSNVDHTSVMDVMDGKGIKAVAVNSSNHLIITYDDDTIVDAGEIDIHSAVNSVNGKTGNVDLTASDVGALPDDTSIPSKTSDLTNDSIVDSASYDSTNHQILFKNGATTLFSLDAAAFVKDGMVDDVEISGGNLVITFNTDAGKQAISIPLTDIFDPANYYDKDDIDGFLADKADKVDNAIADNFAGLDANGNLKDSGKKASDFATPSDIAGQQSLLKDTVGWTGKNLNKKPYTYNDGRTHNGITFTVNSDGSVTANGTASGSDANLPCHSRYGVSSNINPLILPNGKYIISGCPDGGSNSTYSIVANCTQNGSAKTLGQTTGNDVEITLDGDDVSNNSVWLGYTIVIKAGQTVSNLTFYPMLRKADITDPTYEPYHESVENVVEQVYADNGVLGAKNLLPSYSGTITNAGVTYTADSNGIVTCSGTATETSIWRKDYDPLTLKKGKYKLYGGPNIGAAPGIDVFVALWNGTAYIQPDTGTTDTYTFTQDVTVQFTLRIGRGINSSEYVFYPMLRLASDPDDTYQPYAMTNRELTENANGLINHYPDYAWSKNKIIATSGANLNDITTPGLYKCQTGSIASTLVNCPVQSAFGLEVIIGNDVSAFIIQIIKYTVNANEVYMRTYSANSWTSWYKFTGTVVS